MPAVAGRSTGTLYSTYVDSSSSNSSNMSDTSTWRRGDPACSGKQRKKHMIQKYTNALCCSKQQQQQFHRSLRRSSLKRAGARLHQQSACREPCPLAFGWLFADATLASSWSSWVSECSASGGSQKNRKTTLVLFCTRWEIYTSKKRTSSRRQNLKPGYIHVPASAQPLATSFLHT